MSIRIYSAHSGFLFSWRKQSEMRGRAPVFSGPMRRFYSILRFGLIFFLWGSGGDWWVLCGWWVVVSGWITWGYDIFVMGYGGGFGVGKWG